MTSLGARVQVVENRHTPLKSLRLSHCQSTGPPERIGYRKRKGKKPDTLIRCKSGRSYANSYDVNTTSKIPYSLK